MVEVRYSIGEDLPSCSKRKTKSLYLWRDEISDKGAWCTPIARFRNKRAAALFAKDFNYPLSDKIKKIIESVD